MPKRVSGRLWQLRGFNSQANQPENLGTIEPFKVSIVFIHIHGA